MRIYTLNGQKVWLDPETAPAEAIPYGKPKAEPKKAEPKKVEPVKAEEPEQKAKPEPVNKAKKTPANKSRKAGSNK